VWTVFIWLREGKVAGCGEHSSEPAGSIKWEFLGQVRMCYFLRRTLLHGVGLFCGVYINCTY